MKKYSSFRMFVEYISILFVVYLLLSGIISVVGGYTYREILAHPAQMLALIFVYWWLPIFRMCDMENHNKSINQQKTIS